MKFLAILASVFVATLVPSVAAKAATESVIALTPDNFDKVHNADDDTVGRS